MHGVMLSPLGLCTACGSTCKVVRIAKIGTVCVAVPPAGMSWSSGVGHAFQPCTSLQGRIAGTS